jgi:hypothetical protein
MSALRQALAEYRELSAGVCKEPAPTYFWEE